MSSAYESTLSAIFIETLDRLKKSSLDTAPFTQSVHNFARKGILLRLQYGTNQDIVDYLSTGGPLGTVLPLGIRVHMLRQLLENRVPECLCVTFDALVAGNGPHKEEKACKLWSCILKPNSNTSIELDTLGSNSPMYILASHAAFPLLDLHDVKSLCVNVEPDGSACLNMLTSSMHGTATYSIQGQGQSLNSVQAEISSIPTAVPPTATLCSSHVIGQVLPHKNLSYPFTSPKGKLRWCMSAADTNDLHLVNGCLHIAPVIVVPAKVEPSPSGVGATGPQIRTNQHESKPQKTGFSAVSIDTATDDVFMGSQSRLRFGRGPDGQTTVQSGGALHVAAVLSCDISADGSAIAILLEGFFTGGTPDLSTRCAPADGDSDLDSACNSLGSAGMSDLRVFRDRILRGRGEVRTHLPESLPEYVAPVRLLHPSSSGEEQVHADMEAELAHTRSASERNSENEEFLNAQRENFLRAIGAGSSFTTGLTDMDVHDEDLEDDTSEREEDEQEQEDEMEEGDSEPGSPLRLHRRTRESTRHRQAPSGDESMHSTEGSADGRDRDSPLWTVKRRYYVLFCSGNCYGLPITVTSVASLQQTPMRLGCSGPVTAEYAGLQLDQVPSIVRCIGPSLCIVAGTAGLLGLVCSQGISCSSAPAQSSFFALSLDDFSPACITAASATLTDDDGDDDDFIFPPLSHASNSAITTIDCCCQVGPLLAEVGLVSADDEGHVCLWHIRYVDRSQSQTGHGNIECPGSWSGGIKLIAARSAPSKHALTYGIPRHYLSPIGQPLQMQRPVNGLTISPSGSHVVAASATRLLLLLASEKGLVLKATLDASQSTPCKYSSIFVAEHLLVGRVSEAPFDQEPGLILHCWKVASPDRFEARAANRRASPLNKSSTSMPHSGDFSAAASDKSVPVPISFTMPFNSLINKYASLSGTLTEALQFKGLGLTCRAMTSASATAAPIPLNVLAPAHAVLPHASRIQGVPLAAVSLIHSAPERFPILAPQVGLPCERIMMHFFGSSDSAIFRVCKPLLALLLASIDVTIGPFTPTGGVTVSFSLSSPCGHADTEGPPIGLIAAALNMDVLHLHAVLMKHQSSFKHLICYSPPQDFATRTSDFDFEAAMQSSSFARFRSIDAEANALFSPKFRGKTLTLGSPPPPNIAEESSPLREAKLLALAETQLKPTELLLRGGLGHWLSSSDSWRLGGATCVGPRSSAGGANGATSGWGAHSTGGAAFWINLAYGHNALAALYLKNCGNKSVAVEHQWQEYLRSYGPTHLRRSDRGLRELTRNVRKIDETAGIKDTLPRQLGFISGLQEIYARRVGLYGRLPVELCLLQELRVLSMGNNYLTGPLPPALGTLPQLQRIVLHQNKLTGNIPIELSLSGCIVNLAGNPGLDLGPDVPASERAALSALYVATSGDNWQCKSGWLDKGASVSQWYKVGTLAGHVHSLVMSSNGMKGKLPAALSGLQCIRMIELATMPDLHGTLLPVCSLTTLRRLCICRCSLTGEIPSEIGQLSALEELQLFGNRLSGNIPDSVGNLRHLKLLSLGEYTGGNAFNPGPLPACIRRLKSLEALFVSSCHITGPVPAWLSELTGLRQLDLQNNDLIGVLPDSMGELTNLLYLNFKDNLRLGGVLPVPMLSKLRRLNRLSFVNTDILSNAGVLRQLQKALPSCKIWN